VRILLATRNQGKIREIAEALGVAYDFESLLSYPELSEAIESGATFRDNARIKAEHCFQLTGLPTLADDSGLEVDVLGGEPGIRSARAAGETAGDKERIEHLLARLNGIPLEKRTAHFKCVIAVARPNRKTELCYGECAGQIALEPRGEEGFGYDPVFYLPDLGKTMAELPLEIKNQISHRGKAAREAYHILDKIAEELKL